MSGIPKGGAAPRQVLRTLARQLDGATDTALRSLVATIDSLEDRGDADLVLQTARDRLARLRPPRPLTFTRLLFLPLDGAIVAAPRWRRGAPQLPRSAIRPLARAVRNAMAEEATVLAREIRGRSLTDEEAIARFGARLWPRAAGLLPAMAPPDWREATGLGDADYPALAALFTTVLRHGPEIQAALAAAELGPPPELVRAALAPHAEAPEPGPLHVVLAALLRQAARPGLVVSTAASLGLRARALARPMLQAVLDQPPPTVDRLDLTVAARAIAALGEQWRDIEACGLLDHGQRLKLRSLRQEAIRAGCARLTVAGEAEILAPLAALGNEGAGATDQAILGLEQAARRLRVLAQTLGTLGAEGPPPERVLRNLTPRIEAMLRGMRGATPMDLARIVEILDGPEAAAKLLEAAPRAAQPL